MGKTIQILNLYPTRANLYGDSGNMRMLVRRLTERGNNVVVFESPDDKNIDFQALNLVYMGSCTEKERNYLTERLKTFRDDFLTAKDSGCIFLFTGNAMSAFSSEIKLADGTILKGVNLYHAQAQETYERRNQDCVFTNNVFGKCVGFINSATQYTEIENPLFKVEMGVANSDSSNFEGLVEGSIYATQLIGPFLVKNPHALRKFIAMLEGLDSCNDSYEYEDKAFETTLFELEKRIK